MLRFTARRHGGFSLLFFTVAFALLLLPFAARLWAPLEYSIGAVLASLQGMSTLMTAPAAGIAGVVTTVQDTGRLRERVRRLEAEHVELQRLAAEAERLHRLLGLRATLPFAVTPAAVIGRDPSNWYRSLTIDKGSQDGLAQEMAVVTREGVVGTLRRVSPRYAKVLLVTDRNSAVAALNQRTRDQGIVEGLVGGRLRLKYLLRQTDVRVGDVIVTTGLEGIFPKGLMLGRVHRVGREPGELVHAIEITPTVDFTRLETVEVVTVSPIREANEELAGTSR